MTGRTVPHLAPIGKRTAFYATWVGQDTDTHGQAVQDEVGAWWFLADDGRMALLHHTPVVAELPRVANVILHGNVALAALPLALPPLALAA